MIMYLERALFKVFSFSLVLGLYHSMGLKRQLQYVDRIDWISLGLGSVQVLVLVLEFVSELEIVLS